MESRTSCKKVWAIQATMTSTLPLLIADGKEMRAMIANAYAHHMVATPEVIFAASFSLKSLILLILTSYARQISPLNWLLWRTNEHR